MLWPLRQSTAGQVIPLGRFVSSTDGNTQMTALTIANTDIKIRKAGATAMVNKNSGGATHDAGGEYYATLDATDTNTLGPLKVSVHVTGALPVQLLCQVLQANVYDALVAGTDFLDVNALAPDISNSGTTITIRKRDGATTQQTRTGTFAAGADVLIAID